MMTAAKHAATIAQVARAIVLIFMVPSFPFLIFMVPSFPFLIFSLLVV
jgi:hypothetical protein